MTQSLSSLSSFRRLVFFLVFFLGGVCHGRNLRFFKKNRERPTIVEGITKSTTDTTTTNDEEESLSSNLHQITFVGTRNTHLDVVELVPYQYGLTYTHLKDILKLSPSFRLKYEGEVVPEELLMDYYNGNYNEPSSIPNIQKIAGSAFDPSIPTLATNTGFVGSVLTAFNSHNNLQLRPDDLWITILAQVSAYVNGRAEELRDRFVNFQGQQALTVEAPGSIHTADFGAMTQAFLDEISKHLIDETWKDWFLPGFSTTTPTDQVAAAAMAMSSFQQYFSFKYGLICGIPEITLKGTLQDWKLLRQKLERLIELDGADHILSERWVPKLREILDNIVESRKNGSTNNLDFWNHIVSNTGGTCGGPTHLTGWIATFSVFNQDGEFYADSTEYWPTIPLDSIYHNVASCPAEINDNGVKYNATLFVGQMAYEFAIDEEASQNLPQAVQNILPSDGYMRQVRPRNDWALVISQGFTQVPPTDPELEYQRPPDGTLIYGDACPLDPYQASEGSLFDPLLSSDSDSNVEPIVDGDFTPAVPGNPGPEDCNPVQGDC